MVEEAGRSTFMKNCLKGRKGYRAFFAAMGYASERAWGKPTQPVSGPEGEPLETRFIVEFVDKK